MSTKALTRTGDLFPSLFDDFFKPWNEIFGNGGSLISRALTVPAVNITDEKDELSLPKKEEAKKALLARHIDIR